MTRRSSKADGYRLLLVEAEREVAAAKTALTMRRHGAANVLRKAEERRDSLLRLLEDTKPKISAFGPDTMAPDFGVDDEEASR